MDIDLLSKMVRELILVHDRVALPGLGTFVADTVPASFSDKGYTINPPYRKLSFRQGADDDGLLADLYASENSVSSRRSYLPEPSENLKRQLPVIFAEEQSIFFISSLEMCIFKLELCIFRLEICISSLEIKNLPARFRFFFFP